MNSDTVPIKFRLAAKSCRRARIEIPLTMSGVTRKLLTSFPELKPGQFSIQYQDEEGEQIEVVNDADLAEAIAVFNAIDRVLSFSVLPKSTETVESDESDESDDYVMVGNHLQNHWRNHRRWHGRRGGCGRRWHALAHEAAKTVNDTGLQCTFVADGTIPDRSLVPPKESFEKKWIVKTGPKLWPAGCVLTHVGGHPMGTKRAKSKPAPLGPVPANSEVELVVGLKAPKPSRDFVSKWRMCTPDGRQFGDFLWALITVEPNAPAVAVAAMSPLDATKAAATSAVKATKVVAKSAVKAAKVAAKKAVKAAKVAAKSAEAKPAVKAAKAAAKSAVKASKAAAKCAVKAAKLRQILLKAGLHASLGAPPYHPRGRIAVPVAAAVPVVTAAPVAVANPETSTKLQKLQELNFPVPVEVLAYILKSTGGDLNAAIGLLLSQQ